MKFFLRLIAISAVLSFAFTTPSWALLNPTRQLPPGAFAATDLDQNMILLQSGAASFLKRLQMISAARSTIETEFYVYNNSQASRIYTQALIQKARQGVKVRILVDQGFRNTNIDAYFAKVLAEQNVDVRFYNNVPLLKVRKANHRTHRKSLIVDGIEAVVGGRNMADDYFEFSSEYNFVDRDVAVKGSIVTDIRQSFENFWTSNLTKGVGDLPEPKMQEYGISSLDDPHNVTPEGQQALEQFKKDHAAYVNGFKRARTFVIPDPNDQSTLKRIYKYGALLLAIAPKGVCRETYYYADLPGHMQNSRVVRDQVRYLVSTARKSITVESPFFIQKAEDNIFNDALKRGLKVDILTNSLYSADLPITIAPFLTTAKVLTANGANVHIHEGVGPRWLEHPNFAAKTSRWGTHAKSLLLDEDTVLVGSYNMDPRSENLNAEMALVCRGNKELAAGLAYDFELRKSIMVRLDQNGNPVDGRDKHLDSSASKRLIYRLFKPLSYIFESWL